jgi:hypothetical protein
MNDLDVLLRTSRVTSFVSPKSAHGNEISPPTPKKERAYRELIVVKPVKIPVGNDLVDSCYTLKNDDKIKVALST